MKPLTGIILLTIFILLGSPIAKSCDDDLDQVFKASINKECAQSYFKCVPWSDIPTISDYSE